MPRDEYGNEYHIICLLCGSEKEKDESILCYDCAGNYYDMEQDMLQRQLDEIKEGIPPREKDLKT